MEQFLRFDNGYTYVEIRTVNGETTISSGAKRGKGKKDVKGKDFNETVLEHYYTVVKPEIESCPHNYYEEYEQWVKENTKPVYKLRKKIKDDWTETTILWEKFTDEVTIESFNLDCVETTAGNANSIEDFQSLLKEHLGKVTGWCVDNFMNFVKTWKVLVGLDTVEGC